MMMFDPKNIEKHIGADLRYADRLNALREVEEYLHKKIERLPIEISHDCTADERNFYKTINYTTYCGMFIMHPLSYGPTIFQMYDAKADRSSPVGHLEYIANTLSSSQKGKYSGLNAVNELKEFDAVAVLCGSNKFADHVSPRKIFEICKKHGERLVLKPHPVSKDDVIHMARKLIGDAQVAHCRSDLYQLIESSDTVYTTHISETALTALLLGKNIEPIDMFHRRLMGSFSHINHFCFTELQPLETLASIFASPKSGLVHPEVDKDWRKKVDDYLDYTLSMRATQKGHYVE